MKMKTTSIGVKVYLAERYTDERGVYTIPFRDANNGPGYMMQDSVVRSAENVLRGFHYQTGNSAQTKWVSCLSGAFVDVVLDLRPDSKMLGKWERFYLTPDGTSILIPRGCAHACLSLEDDSTLWYKVDEPYDPDAEAGVNVFDDLVWQAFGGIDVGTCTVNERDRSWPGLKEVLKELVP